MAKRRAEVGKRTTVNALREKAPSLMGKTIDHKKQKMQRRALQKGNQRPFSTTELTQKEWVPRHSARLLATPVESKKKKEDNGRLLRKAKSDGNKFWGKARSSNGGGQGKMKRVGKSRRPREAGGVG